MKIFVPLLLVGLVSTAFAGQSADTLPVAPVPSVTCCAPPAAPPSCFAPAVRTVQVVNAGCAGIRRATWAERIEARRAVRAHRRAAVRSAACRPGCY